MGLSILSGNKISYLNTLLYPKNELDGFKLLKQIQLDIEKLILQYSVRLVTIEGYSYSVRSAHSALLHELNALIKNSCYELSIPIIVIQPMTLKKFVTGIGKGQKEEIIEAIQNNWFVKFDVKKENDLADALSLAILGSCLYTYFNQKTINELNKSQQEVISGLINKYKIAFSINEYS